MANWKADLPQLPAALKEDVSLQQASLQAIEDDEYVERRLFSQQWLEGVSGGSLEFKACRFDHCRLTDVEVGRISFVDCEFNKCEMSNLTLQNAALKRVTFQDCHLTGLGMEKTALTDARFQSCMMDYLSVSESKLDRVTFADCRLRESFWNTVRLGRVAFDKADLVQSEWSFTPLYQQDLSTCRIDGIRIALADLRGLRLTSHQLVALSGLLGVEVTDV